MATATASKPTVLYPLWPKQHEAMRLLGFGPYRGNTDVVEEMLYGGEAGGGKSYLLRAVAVDLCLSQAGVTVALFRRTYTELEETHIKKIQEELPRELGVYNGSRHEWTFPNNSVLEFRYCEHDNDVYHYNSAEWDALLLDEATQFTEHQVRYLRSRVRSTKPGWKPKLVFTANPGNVGHLYFKAGFVDAAPAGQRFDAPTDDGGARRVFLKAKLADNPSLGMDYRKKLEGIKDEALRRALMDGDWDVFSGQVFREWRRDVHVVKPFVIPARWPRWRAIDYGYNAPWCCLWLTMGPDRSIYVYREIYETGIVDRDQAQRIALASGDERIGVTFADPSMWNKQANGASIAHTYAEWGVPLTKANNDRMPGWQRIHHLLTVNPDTGKPSLYIFETCLNLIRTLPALTYDERVVEDVNTKAEDHAGDTLRYAVMGAAVAQPLPEPQPYTNAMIQQQSEWSPFGATGGR